MKARLLIVNPDKASRPPAAPSLILEEDGWILVHSAGWFTRVKEGALETAQPEDFRHLPGIGLNDCIYLSEPRILPSSELLSEDLLLWAEEWWKEAVAAAGQREPMAQAC